MLKTFKKGNDIFTVGGYFWNVRLGCQVRTMYKYDSEKELIVPYQDVTEEELQEFSKGTEDVFLDILVGIAVPEGATPNVSRVRI